ncbi:MULTISPECIES: LUD domain-containing protein [Methanobacterium]|uniref:LUD domain-containing protein n=1 Tax=Methanobacterium veterum TaxID=408577 RepID=A0A9E4ZY09_9EURY|nr:MULTISPECIES: LUD domain-containing protein [Methanobacterium]MCZ3367474.1 LUD domain-containing protein [Methanobacterium veterum]MCZ3373378.1 LUD domain-containing protein [Methanobacterium veterum]
MDDAKLDAMRRSFNIIETRKKKLLKDENERISKLQERVKKIREYSIGNLEELIETAKNRFLENGMEVIFAENSQVALDEIYKLIKDEPIIAKSKSNNVNEIGLSAFLGSKGIEIVETDLGDRIVQMDPESYGPSHPIGPAAHLDMEKIAQIASKKFGVEVQPEPKSILDIFKADIIERLTNCNVGITGANSVAAEDGALVMVHNEGNISLVSMKDTHIVVVGIDKLVRTVEDAVSVVKLETIFATGKKIPAYMNVITSPSKTADIEQVLLKDMYGAKRVIVILLDNGRSDALKQSKECLLCIGCGSCIVSCPVYNVTGSDFGYRGYLGGRGIVLSNFITDNKICFDSGLFKCTLCGLCTLECPVNIKTNEMIEKLREMSVQSGVCPDEHHGTSEKIKKQGSPF